MMSARRRKWPGPTPPKRTSELSKTQDTLKQTQTQLADSNAERDKAVATATAQTKRADDLSDKLAKTTQDRDQAQTELAAYKATGVSAEQVGKLNRIDQGLAGGA